MPLQSGPTPPPSPWYRHFWVWVVAGLPLVTIAAGVYTLFLAGEHPDALVVDDYYREGLAINRRLEREATARALAIRARLQLDLAQGTLALEPEHGFGRPRPTLVLSFIHPTLRERDREFVLHAESDSGIYHADGVNIGTGLWHIRLRASEADWQLDTTVTLSRRQTLMLSADDNRAPEAAAAD